MSGESPPRLVLFDQGGGPLSSELAGHLAKVGAEVELFAPAPAGSALKGEGFRRVRTARHRNASAVGRLAGWALFLAQGALRALWGRGRPLLVLTTNPPLAPCIGLLGLWLRRRPFALILWDIYPEALERLSGLSPSSLLSRTMRGMNRMAVARAKVAVTLAPGMADLLRQYGPAEVVPTWVDAGFIRPRDREGNDFARRHGLVGQKTVLYSGNIGRVHDLSLLPALAERFAGDPEVRFVVIGDGPGRGALVEEIERRGLRNILLLPFQPREVLPLSLASADIAIVSLAAAAEGISMPSKTYYHLAAGSGLLAICRPGSDLAAVVERHGCGLRMDPQDLDGGARALKELFADPERLGEMKRRAREAVEAYYSAEAVLPRMAEALLV